MALRIEDIFYWTKSRLYGSVSIRVFTGKLQKAFSERFLKETDFS